jgi:competence protein ComEA
MRPEPASLSDRPPLRRRRPRARSAEGSAGLGVARLRAWAPLVMRAAACGLALLGLAGIGVAASRSPELSAIGSPKAMFDAAGMSRALAAAPMAREMAPAPSSPAPVAPVSAAAPSPGSTATPCPTRADAESSAPEPSAAGAAGRSVEGKAEPPVFLNQASASELQRLPGVGPKRAEAILQLRLRLGRFRRPSDLLRIKGIGPRTLQRMLPQLVLDAP